jgi:two-component system, NtrC family, sensor kinase
MGLAFRLARGLAAIVNTVVRPAHDIARVAPEGSDIGGQRRKITAIPIRRLGNIARWVRRYSDNHTTAIRGRPRRGLTWPLHLLLAASLMVPLLLLAFAAWQNLRLVQVEAEQRVMIETGELREHVLSALDTYALVLAWIDDRSRGLDWDSIDHDDGLRRFLAEMGKLPQIGEALIVDRSGRIRASDRPLAERPADASRREAFAAQQQRDAGIFIGHDPLERPVHTSFDVSRRRPTSDESFDGVLIVSAKPDYFSDFLSTISQEQGVSASLMRNDGRVLVRHPPLSGSLIYTADRPVMKAIASDPDGGVFNGSGGTDGVERLLGYRRVGGYPLYVVFGIPTQGVLHSWRANLIDYLLFAVPASLGLFCMTLFAVRQLQQQKVASWRWRTTAQRLKREMNRRARAEAGLFEAQKMESLGQLTGGAAHDFNNLLTVLQGCLEMLSGHQRDAKLQARVEMALATVERGERLTSNLLAFARRQPLTVARVDINDLLRRISGLLVQTIGNEIRVASDLSPDLWPVDVDASQLEFAVINLAINARDAMPTGGVLRLRTFNTTNPPEQPRVGDFEGGEFVALEISDTGTGMPPEVMARAFEPFFTSKGPGKGTGLGLSIVYGFARQSGGWATIRSEVGRGSAVTMLLPRSGEPGSSNETEAIDLPPGAAA